MAKYKKMMPPRRTSIRGQDHLLAYITPEEAQMLMDQGGSGEAGPMGIPAFVADFSGEEGDDFSSGSYGNDDGSLGSYAEDTSESQPSITAEQVAAMNAAQKAMQFTPYAEAMKDPIFSGDESAAIGLEGQSRSLGGITRAQYNAMPSYMQTLLNPKSPFFTGAYQYEFGKPNKLGVTPVTGFYGPSLLDNVPLFGGGLFSKAMNYFMGPPQTEADLMKRASYTGYGEGSMLGSEGGGSEDIKPVDEEGKCPEGYIFDEDLQACRLDTGASAGAVGSVVPPAPGGYARMGLLDVAPTGLPQFQQTYGVGFGTPADFGAANLAFRQRGATYPEFYQNPPQLSGYTLLS